MLRYGMVLCAGIAIGTGSRLWAEHLRTDTWWTRETQMTADGRLMLSSKPWWARAKALREGERFTLDLNGDGRPDTIVTRLEGDIVEAIDDTGQAKEIWNNENTTYVVSYGGTGSVDRMVSYLGNGHGGAREVELRYFRDGYLRYAWFAESEDGDAARIFAMKRWQYAGNDQGSEFRGNAQIYINKYDPKRKAWQPLSECPFTFWDTDHDGRTDVTLRVSAAPLESLHGPDTDYANNYDYMWAHDATPLSEMGALNMRLSLNLDAVPRTEPVEQPHSTFSFTMTGKAPYVYAGMRDFNARRRAPQTTIHMPWASRWTAATNYAAQQVGFSWDEAHQVHRWEGEFWIYERRYLSNTGSPTQRWNMRREYAEKPSERRQLYFSAADQRYHMRGASEGWLEVSAVNTDAKLLEFRWWDSDHDGLLDTVEVFRGNSQVPARISHFEPRAEPVALNQEALAREYNAKVLPKAIGDDEAVIAALKLYVTDDDARSFELEADRATFAERRRYMLDVARELLFLRFRERVLKLEATLPYPEAKVDDKRFRDPAAGTREGGYTLGDSLRFWALTRNLHELDTTYAQGDFVQFVHALREVGPAIKEQR